MEAFREVWRTGVKERQEEALAVAP